jgi:hypothetical protein
MSPRPVPRALKAGQRDATPAPSLELLDPCLDDEKAEAEQNKA